MAIAQAANIGTGIGTSRRSQIRGREKPEYTMSILA
jgi:hypothetical protein